MIDLFNNKLPYNLRDIYILNSELHLHATKRSNNIHKQFYRTNYGYYSIQCKGTNFYTRRFEEHVFPKHYNCPQLLDARNEACAMVLRSLRTGYSIKTFSVFPFQTIKLIEASAHEPIAIVSHDMK